LSAAAAQPGNVTVKVLDESGRGVESRVYYYNYKQDANAQIPWAETNKDGVALIAGGCPPIASVRAHPLDIGSYFESRQEPCFKGSVVLRVFHKQTPIGVALKEIHTKVEFGDGTQGVAIFRMVLASSHSDIVAKSQCEVSITPQVDTQVYLTSSDAWTAVQMPTRNPDVSKVLNQIEGVGRSLAADVSSVSVSLPFNCGVAESRINAVQASAEKYAVEKFGVPTLAEVIGHGTSR